MAWLIDEVFALAIALADELGPFRGDTEYALLPDRPTCFAPTDPLVQYRGSTTVEVGIGAVFLALRPIYNRFLAGLNRAEEELQTLPPTVADEVRRLQRIVNGTHGKIGFAEVGKHFANSDLGAVVGKRGWEAVLRHLKPLPFPSAESEAAVAKSAESDSDNNEHFVFAPDGTEYYITGFGEHGHVNKLKGFHRIYRLNQTPGKPVLMLTLIEADDNKRIAAEKRSQQLMLSPTSDEVAEQGDSADTTARSRAGRLKDRRIAKRNLRIKQLCEQHKLHSQWAKLAEVANADEEIQALNLDISVTRDIARNAVQPPKKRRR